jgi:hypothetical protein
MGFRFTQDGEVIYVPEEIKVRFKDEVAAILSEAREASAGETLDEAPGDEPRDAAPQQERRAETEPRREREESAPPLRIHIEEEEPQTQMAAAFAALKLDQLASDTPPEETKA